MHDGSGGGVAQGGGRLGRARHLVLCSVQTAPAQRQLLAYKEMGLVGHTKSSEMNYQHELHPPKFRHPFV